MRRSRKKSQRSCVLISARAPGGGVVERSDARAPAGRGRCAQHREAGSKAPHVLKYKLDNQETFPSREGGPFDGGWVHKIK